MVTKTWPTLNVECTKKEEGIGEEKEREGETDIETDRMRRVTAQPRDRSVLCLLFRTEASGGRVIGQRVPGTKLHHCRSHIATPGQGGAVAKTWRDGEASSIYPVGLTAAIYLTGAMVSPPGTVSTAPWPPQGRCYRTLSRLLVIGSQNVSKSLAWANSLGWACRTDRLALSVIVQSGSSACE